jgi:hypothetical protein
MISCKVNQCLSAGHLFLSDSCVKKAKHRDATGKATKLLVAFLQSETKFHSATNPPIM